MKNPAKVKMTRLAMQAKARTIILKSDWFQFDKIGGLRLDGYYDAADLKAFIWAIKNDADWLEKQSTKE